MSEEERALRFPDDPEEPVVYGDEAGARAEKAWVESHGASPEPVKRAVTYTGWEKADE